MDGTRKEKKWGASPPIPSTSVVWATKLLLAAIGLVFPALVLGYNFFIVESMTYQFLYRLKNLYDYRLQQ